MPFILIGRRLSSREKAKAKRSSVDGSDEQKCFWLLSGCCKATADQIHITMPFMPLLKLAIFFQSDAPKIFVERSISTHDQVLMNFATMLITVSTTRARARRVGVAGEPGEEQGAHEQQGFGRPLIPPAKK
jgi:hypothetical protein